MMAMSSRESVDRVRGGACCTDEKRMVRCTMNAMEKMKEMFGAANDNLFNQPNDQITNEGCAMDAKCRSTGCPFRKPRVSPDAMRKFIEFLPVEEMGKKRAEHNSLHLMPGEVGLQDNRATFHLGQNPERPVPLEDGKPKSTVYYNLPTARGKKARKHVMQVLPTLENTSEPFVGPVTGLPISDAEDVFVLRCSKRYESDEKSNIQIEIRVPRLKVGEPVTKEDQTQYLTTDVGEPEKPATKTKGKKKGGKGDKKGKGGKNKAGKKGKK